MPTDFNAWPRTWPAVKQAKHILFDLLRNGDVTRQAFIVAVEQRVPPELLTRRLLTYERSYLLSAHAFRDGTAARIESIERSPEKHILQAAHRVVVMALSVCRSYGWINERDGRILFVKAPNVRSLAGDLRFEHRRRLEYAYARGEREVKRLVEASGYSKSTLYRWLKKKVNTK